MKISEIKKHLATLEAVAFKLPNGSTVPAHFHVTEVGRVAKHFIDCGGVERHETKANFQLWVAADHEHRLAPQKLLRILDMSEKILGKDDLDIEVEYQQETIGVFELDFDGSAFVLKTKQTACLAEDACGIPSKKQTLDIAQPSASCCAGSGCC